MQLYRFNMLTIKVRFAVADVKILHAIINGAYDSAQLLQRIC